jgi:multiple sugar transport system permease protein
MSAVSRRVQRQAEGTLRAVLLALYLLFALFPIYWIVKISFTPDRKLFKEAARLWPSSLTLDHFSTLFSGTPFLVYFKNSLIVSGSTAILVVLLAALAGYALSRFRFAGAGLARGFLLATQIFPLVLLITPLYRIFATLGLINTLPGLVLIYVVFNLPFAVFLMQGFFDNVPAELEEAALIDGCTRFAAFRRVVLPMTLPGIVATLGFAFTGAWSELLFGLMFINSDANKTVAVGLLNFVGKFGVDWGQITAAAVISLLPVFLFFGIIQRYLISGLTVGAVKG